MTVDNDNNNAKQITIQGAVSTRRDVFCFIFILPMPQLWSDLSNQILLLQPLSLQQRHMLLAVFYIVGP
jgi:hypothetical protein